MTYIQNVAQAQRSVSNVLRAKCEIRRFNGTSNLLAFAFGTFEY